MDDQQLQAATPTDPNIINSGKGIATDVNASVAQSDTPQNTYSTEDLETYVLKEEPVTQAPVVPPKHNLLAFSRRKAMIVSISITVLATVFTGVSLLLVAHNSAKPNQSNKTTAQSQDVTIKGAAISVIPPELQGANQSLLVNGDLATRGNLKLSDSSYAATIKTQSPNANQTYLLPNSSGSFCLDSNNCNYVTQAQFTSGQSQASGLPQDLSIDSSPTFAGLTLGGTKLQGASGGSSTFTLPSSTGSANQCLVTNGAGVLSFVECVTGGGVAFVQGGNSFGATGTIGTTDTQDFKVITNNSTRLTVKSNGNIGINSTNPQNQLTVNSPWNNDSSAAVLISTGNVANKGLVVQALPTQLGNLFELQKSDATALLSISANGNTTFVSGDNSSSAFQVQNSSNYTVLSVDAQNKRVGIDISNPQYPLDVVGNVHIDALSALIIGGSTVCTSAGCGAAPGSSNYISNGFTVQSNANFAIQSVAANAIGAQIRGHSSQTSDLFQLQVSTGTPVFKVGSTGEITVQPSVDSLTAFQIQNLAGTSNLLIADTQNNVIGIGKVATYKLDVNGTVNVGITDSYRINGQVACQWDAGLAVPGPACASASGSGFYIQNGTSLQTSANIAIQSAQSNLIGVKIRGAASQTADILELQSATGGDTSPLFKVTATGEVVLQNSTNSTGAFVVKDTVAEGNNVFVVDTVNKRVGINEFPSLFPLDVNGNLNLDNSGAYYINGTQICDLTGCSANGNSGAYVKNQSNILQTSATFYIQAGSSSQVGGRILAASGQGTGTDIFQVQNSSANSTLFGVNGNGDVTLQNTSNSGSAFAVKDNGGTNTVLSVNTSTQQVLGVSTLSSAIVGTTSNSSSYGIVGQGSSTGAVGGGIKGQGYGSGLGVYGASELNSSGYFQTSNTGGTNTKATLVAQANTGQTSSNLLEIQGTAGSTNVLFGVDTSGNVISSNNVIRLDGNNSAVLQTWSNTSALGIVQTQHATVSNGSYIYTVGGVCLVSIPNCPASGLTSTVRVAPINSDGTVGSWSTTTSLGTGNERSYPGAVIYNGYMYVVGGADSTGTVSSTVFYGKINADGTISSWSVAGFKMSTAVAGAAAVTHNGYIYVIGGATTDVSGTLGAPINTVQYAKLSPDGSVGTFSQLSSTNLDARMAGQAVASNGFLYYVGGQDVTPNGQRDVYYTQFNSDGTIATWTKQTSVLTVPRAFLGVGILNGYLYAVGGGDSAASPLTSYEYSRIGASGVPGNFTSVSGALTVASKSLGMATANGYFYMVSGSGLGEVQYAGGPRVYVGGSLDLVGIAGQSLQSGSSGGTLTAGNTLIAGSLRVTSTGNFAQSVNISGDLAANGSSVFRNTTDSISSFQIQNAAGQALLYADTADNIIAPGIVSARVPTNRYDTLIASVSGHDITTQSINMVLGNDKNPIATFYDSNASVKKLSVVRCNNEWCTTGGGTPQTFSPPSLLPPTASFGVNSSIVISPVTGNPVIGVLDTGNNTLNHLVVIKCGNADCSSSNHTLTDNFNVTGTGAGVVAFISSGRNPLFFYKHGGSARLAVEGCRLPDCSGNDDGTQPNPAITGESIAPNTGIFTGMNLGGTGANIAAVQDSQDGNPLVAYANYAAGVGSLRVVHCTNSDCSGNFAGSTMSPAITLTGGNAGDNIGSYLAMSTSHGNPVMAAVDNTASGIAFFACTDHLCNNTPNSTLLAAGLVSANGMSMTIGSDLLPIISYRAIGVDALQVIHCGNPTCTSGNVTTSIAGPTGDGGYPAIALQYNGFPIITHEGTNSSIYALSCVDYSCESLGKTIQSGGISLGSTGATFAGVYLDSINANCNSQTVCSPRFKLTNDGTFTANALSTDTNQNVIVQSVSSTAFLVQNGTSTNLLSVDGTNNSVNFGTSTSINGYGFNSSVASVFKNSTNSTGAFNIQDSSGVGLFNANTTSGYVTIGNSSASTLSPIAADSSASGGLSGSAATTYYYKVTAVTPTGETSASNEQSINGAGFTSLTPSPLSSVTTATSGGSIAAGTYLYKITYTTANGESTASTTSTITTTGATSKNTLNIPAPPTGVTTMKIYRNKVNTGSGGTFYLLPGSAYTGSGTCSSATGTITPATTWGTACIDTYNDTSLVTAYSVASNSARTNTNNATVTFSSVSGATSYKIYRGTSSGGENMYQTTASSPYTDTGISAGTSALPPTSTGRRLGINTDSPTANLEVQGNTILQGNSTTSGNAVSILANGLTTGNGLSVASSTGQYRSGSLLSVSQVASYAENTADAGNLFNISRSLTATNTEIAISKSASCTDTNSGPSTGQATYGCSLTVGTKSNRLLVVYVAERYSSGNATGPSTAPTYGGVPMTLVKSFNSVNAVNQWVGMYMLPNSSIGTLGNSSQAISVQFPSAVVAVIGAVSYYNVDQTYLPTSARVPYNVSSFSATTDTISVPTFASTDVITGMGFGSGANTMVVSTPATATTEANTNNTFGFSGCPSCSGMDVIFTIDSSHGGISNPKSITVTETPATTDMELMGFAMRQASGSTLNVEGALAQLSSACGATGSAVCGDKSNILLLQQKFASASGAVLAIQNAGTGADIQLGSGLIQTEKSDSVATTNIQVKSGDGTGFNSGDVSIDSGSASSATAGTVNIGATNSPTVNIGSVGSTTKATAVHIADTSSSANIQGVTIGSTANAGNTVLIQGGTGTSAVQIQAGAAATIKIGTSTNLTVTIGTAGGTLTVVSAATFNGTLTVAGHIISGGTAFTGSNISANANCGAGCTVSITGNDTAGIVTINTGTGVAAGTLATITFSGSGYASAPTIVLTPSGIPASSIYPQYYYGSTTTTFDVKAYNALTDSKNPGYTFSYHVIQ